MEEEDGLKEQKWYTCAIHVLLLWMTSQVINRLAKQQLYQPPYLTCCHIIVSREKNTGVQLMLVWRVKSKHLYMNWHATHARHILWRHNLTGSAFLIVTTIAALLWGIT